ncbi:hypothetical protein SAMN05192574_101619 [Mucilaginibacter gossypiicola]|uniref:Uncharacterized protein n=1 Tax=Mucilaginibacter gossypiicola TaxID=551995 RepID=A0A1H8ASR2_9SPHI|nr:hypothetical protein [Mucilaginibacter gossypiicola]SEM72848.1 hypothetical protein SAMN05192574_101619 [Mucilaginibacter gossypiicola]
MIYQTEEFIEPFWAEFAGSASGRDPLAIQNSSVVIYAKMMVGITNVTNRIRYIGFYCWLLELILKRSTVKGSLLEQLRYIRRAELLLAYTMVTEFPEVTGVSGSAFANRKLEDDINLIAGADWDNPAAGQLYWTFRAGVFGQYYSGVVRDLGLINHPNTELNIYSLTQEGSQLGDYFGANISAETQAQFWECLKTGQVQRIKLAQFQSFALHQIPESLEVIFYRQLLLARDDRAQDSSYRKQTILLLLTHLAEHPEGTTELPLNFLRENYCRQRIQSELDTCAAAAWYIYELNELTHVGLEYFHACLLWCIQEYPMGLDERLDFLVAQTSLAFADEDLDSLKTTMVQLMNWVQQGDTDTYAYYEAMQSAFRQGAYGLCLSKSIMLLISIYRDFKPQFSRITQLAAIPEFNFNRTGYVVELLTDLVKNTDNQTVEIYTRNLLVKVINMHMFSSFSKTRIGQALVHNYMIEDGMIWRLRETYPNRTTPRLQNAVQYLEDVKWLQREEKKIIITALGNKLLTDAS